MARISRPRHDKTFPSSRAKLDTAAASVVELVALPDLNAKVFGTAAGDPAVNGLYTYIAFFGGAAEGWRVYRLGDFEDFEVLASAPGRIDLEVNESAVDSERAIRASKAVA